MTGSRERCQARGVPGPAGSLSGRCLRASGASAAAHWREARASCFPIGCAPEGGANRGAALCSPGAATAWPSEPLTLRGEARGGSASSDWSRASGAGQWAGARGVGRPLGRREGNGRNSPQAAPRGPAPRPARSHGGERRGARWAPTRGRGLAVLLRPSHTWRAAAAVSGLASSALRRRRGLTSFAPALGRCSSPAALSGLGALPCGDRCETRSSGLWGKYPSTPVWEKKG